MKTKAYLGSSNAALLNFVGGRDLRVEYQSSLGERNKSKVNNATEIEMRAVLTSGRIGWVELRRGNPVLRAMEEAKHRPVHHIAGLKWAQNFGRRFPSLQNFRLQKELGATVILRPHSAILSRASFGALSGPQSIGLHAVPAPGTAVISTGVERASKGSYGTGRATIRPARVDGYKLGTR
ncbi:hypothetical protein C8F04DRAFT_1237712 [Mycena alexandri]|uniref:Uncharacterized protein n=1 Tax=Mycena alexandri TaxID=1745969 RepID=A0AAD6SJV2_9AGAR|nr:hypothetical protein C8F04DRAFT_1237712 [Mycena alexandri]